MVRLSEMLGRIDGKLDGALTEQAALRSDHSKLRDRVEGMEKQISRLVGWAIGAGFAGSAATQAITRLGIFHL